MTSTTPTSPVLNGAEAKLVDGVAKQLFIDGCLAADAVERGAKVLTGGEVAEGKGYIYPPTVLTGVPRDARMSDE